MSDLFSCVVDVDHAACEAYTDQLLAEIHRQRELIDDLAARLWAAEEAAERNAGIECADCPVREACLDYTLAAGEPEGIFGGLDPRERYRLRRRRRAS